MRYLLHILLLFVLVALGLTACGGKRNNHSSSSSSSSSSTSGSSSSGVPLDPSESELTPIDGSKLILLEDEALKRYIKNGIHASVVYRSTSTSSSSGISGSSSSSNSLN